MKKYAIFLNFDNADRHCPDISDICPPDLREQLTHRMICGTGHTKELAMQDALRRLIDENVIETFDYPETACDTLKLRSEDDAFRHMWFYHDGTEYSPHYHRELVDFCDRFRLPVEAEEYLLDLFADATQSYQ